MTQIALGRLDQIGNQVVAPLELHLYLREGILEARLEADQLVVDRDHVDDDQRDGAQQQKCFHDESLVMKPLP